MLLNTLKLLSLPLFLQLPFFITVLAEQPTAPKPISAPLRDLEWGEVNFLHTTDTHGWLAGHLQEPSYSADWGDYISFATRMREKAESHGWDLLVVDTGDRVEGNGLYDSSEPKGVYISEILRQQHIDLICSGNHELYKQNTSEAELVTTVPNFRGSYLSSNIDIVKARTHEIVPLAPRYKKFTTKNQGIRIVAFGFLFDFTGNDKNTFVQPVEKTVKESWFREAIRDADVDLFVVIGHVALRSKEYYVILRAIRAIHRDTPVQFFGGHWHIRDYVRYDSRAYGLASGRFMETIGFMSIKNLSTSRSDGSEPAATPTFHRRYIDNNLLSFYHHTGLNGEEFATDHGRNVSRLIHKSRTALNLDQVHGCAPRDLWMSRSPYPSKDSIYTWLAEQVLPDSVGDTSRKGRSAFVVVNTGAIRFDIFKGPFTQDTTFIVSPFTSGFRYVRDIPRDQAQLVVDVLNKQPQILNEALPTSASRPELPPPVQLGDAEISGPVEVSFGEDATAVGQIPLELEVAGDSDVPLIPGYTTVDDAGVDGDDTIHSPITFYRVPNCIQATVSPDPATVSDTVDLVYIDFIQPHVALAAKYAGVKVDFATDSEVFMPGMTLTNVILDWVKDNWKCPTQ